MSDWKTVYVFISSTFNDMHAERDYLVCHVFPEAREWCAAHRIHLIDVDLRWGVTEEDALSNKKLIETCLKGIDKCLPFFICLSGQRRGFIPGITDNPDKFLECYPHLRGHLGDKSITELEILHALVRHDKAVDYLFFERDPEYLQKMPDIPQLKAIYTGNPEGKPESFKIQLPADSFKYRAKWDKGLKTPEISIPTACFSHFPGVAEGWRKKWHDAGLDVPDGCVKLQGELLEKAEEFNRSLIQGRLSEFTCDGRAWGSMVLDKLRRAILWKYPDHSDISDSDGQDAFIEQERAYYVVPEHSFEVLDQYIASEDDRPLVITSPSGYGKTALTANWPRAGASADIVKGFAGVGGWTDPSAFAERMYQKLKIKPGKGNIFKTPLENLVSDAPAGSVLIVDGWDLLDPGLNPGWLQRKLPQGVKLIVTLSTDTPRAVEIRDFLKGTGTARVYELQGLTKEEKHTLVDEYLGRFLKTLDEALVNRLIDQPAACSPLYLRTGLSLLRIHSTHESLGELIEYSIGPTLESVFKGMLERLRSLPQTSDIHPGLLADAMFSVSCLARHAMSAGELAEIISFLPGFEAFSVKAAEEEVNRLIRHTDTLLRRIGGKYMPICDTLTAVCTKKLDAGLIHRAISLFYQSRLKNQKTGSQDAVLNIVHHLLGFDLSGAANMLLDPWYLQSRIVLGMPEMLQRDFAAAAQSDPILGQLGDILLKDLHILHSCPESICNSLYFNGGAGVKKVIDGWRKDGKLPSGLLELENVDLPHLPEKASGNRSIVINFRSVGWSPLAYGCAPGRGVFLASLLPGDLTVISESDSESFSAFKNSIKFSICSKPATRLAVSEDGVYAAAAFRDASFTVYRLVYGSDGIPVGCVPIFEGGYRKIPGELPVMGWAGHRLIWQQEGMLRLLDADGSADCGIQNETKNIIDIPLAQGELVSVSGNSEYAFVGIKGRASFCAVIKDGILVEKMKLTTPPLAVACKDGIYAVAAWNGDIYIEKDGVGACCHAKTPVRSCAIIEDGVVCIDMHKNLCHIDWGGNLSDIGPAPEEASGAGCIFCSFENSLYAVSSLGRCCFTIKPSDGEAVFISLISGTKRRAVVKNGEDAWIADINENKALHFYIHGDGEYVGNPLGELASYRSYGFHNLVPGTLEGLPEHFMPTVMPGERIILTAGREAGGFYAFGESGIYLLRIKSGVGFSGVFSDNAVESTRIGSLGSGLSPVRAAASGKNLLLLAARESNRDGVAVITHFLIVFSESQHGSLESAGTIGGGGEEYFGLEDSRICGDGKSGFYILAGTGLYQLSGSAISDGASPSDGMVRLEYAPLFPSEKFCHLPGIGIFSAESGRLHTLNPDSGASAVFAPAGGITDLAVWDSEAVVVIGEKNIYRVNWRSE